jgi:ribose transport system substrate-binding protein
MRIRVGLATSAAMLLAIVIAAGGSSATVAVAKSTGAAASASHCLAAAKAGVTQASAPITPVFPTQSVDSAKNRGKTIWFIQSAEVQTLNVIADGVKAAATAAGMKVVIFQGNSSPALYNTGLQDAVNQKAAGIILQGIDPALVKTPLAEAQKDHIPTIDSMNGDPGDPLQHGISSHVTVSFSGMGQAMADYILSSTKCQANVLELTSSLFVALQDTHKGFTSTMGSLCPQCKVDTQQVNFESLSSSVTSVVSAAAQSNPKLNFVMATDDGIAFYVVPTLHDLRLKLPAASADGDAANLTFVAKGQSQVVDISFPPLAYIGWKQVDLLQRAMLGMTVPSGAIPTQLIDKANVSANPANQFPKFAGYQQVYEKLWGIH